MSKIRISFMPLPHRSVARPAGGACPPGVVFRVYGDCSMSLFSGNESGVASSPAWNGQRAGVRFVNLPTAAVCPIAVYWLIILALEGSEMSSWDNKARPAQGSCGAMPSATADVGR